MSQLNVDTIKNRLGTSVPSFLSGATITGVLTATTFSGNITGTAATRRVASGKSKTHEDIVKVENLESKPN